MNQPQPTEHAVRAALDGARRVVVKVGSALLTDPSAGLAADRLDALCAEVNALLGRGQEVLLVSSGAVAEGCARLGWHERPVAEHEPALSIVTEALHCALREPRRILGLTRPTQDFGQIAQCHPVRLTVQ